MSEEKRNPIFIAHDPLSWITHAAEVGASAHRVALGKILSTDAYMWGYRDGAQRLERKLLVAVDALTRIIGPDDEGYTCDEIIIASTALKQISEG